MTAHAEVPRTVHLITHVDPTLAEQVKQLAKADHRTVSAYVRALLAEHVKTNPAPLAATRDSEDGAGGHHVFGA